ncbi:hypothetical protein HMPREF9241_01668 [Schaalia turicensis ACS-279-V-Col4]|uniref:HTH cro/C1-type domain-containing protein n=1 Tax=Schaalia turicensis ACS-279-V-Col4 TaxID=883077 RepID=K0YML5_9ACTO|nr:helix-turn-helix transcriptional regulator [Schaalia turicensis]EJZ84892.1 hypothetical protein HMPREF9241_01668 [Schaalia turicensis ACS-279-V-Col4]
MNIATVVRVGMRMRHWSALKLANEAGVTDQSIYNVLDGRTPNINTLAGIARAFDMETSELISIAEEAASQAA